MARRVAYEPIVACRSSKCTPHVVGNLSLTYDGMELPADPGLTIFTYTAEPGSRSEEALNLLASWAATHDEPETALATDEA